MCVSKSFSDACFYFKSSESVIHTGQKVYWLVKHWTDKQTVETKAKKTNKQKNTSIPESFGHLLQTNNSYIIQKEPNKQQGGKKSNHM